MKKHDYTEATESAIDVTLLPKVMQVRDFGKRSRTKYTHLLDQDTTIGVGGFGGSEFLKKPGAALPPSGSKPPQFTNGCFLCGGAHLKKGRSIYIKNLFLILKFSKTVHKMKEAHPLQVRMQTVHLELDGGAKVVTIMTNRGESGETTTNTKLTTRTGLEVRDETVDDMVTEIGASRTTGVTEETMEIDTASEGITENEMIQGERRDILDLFRDLHLVATTVTAEDTTKTVGGIQETTLWTTIAEMANEYGQINDFYLLPSYVDRKSTRLNSSHSGESRMPSSA